MQLPEGPDAYELELLIMRTKALVELRCNDENRDRAEALAVELEAEIQDALDSPTKHRDWKVARPRVEQLLAELDRMLYYERPQFDAAESDESDFDIGAL